MANYLTPKALWKLIVISNIDTFNNLVEGEFT